MFFISLYLLYNKDKDWGEFMSKKKKKRNYENDSYKKEKIENKEVTPSIKRPVEKSKRNWFVGFLLILVLLGSLGYFLTGLFFQQKVSLFQNLVESLILVFFVLLFFCICITSRKKGTVILGSLLLLGYFSFGIITNMNLVLLPNFGQVENFTGKSLTEVIDWAEKNKIEVVQDYEYSDMVPEYSIISQDVSAGSRIKGIESIQVSVSEGPNPSKEVMVPNMVTWDSERVIYFINENYLSNVDIEFVSSEQAVDTVIEQSKSGNLKRDENFKLTFSYGEELGYSEVKLIDFTKKSKFEVMFYMKQHQLKYEFKEKFSNKIKNGFAVDQSKKPGTMVKINDETIEVSISKGPKIKVPDLKKMSVSEITDWVIKNRLKLELTDRYDDSVKDNQVIEVNYSKGDVISQKTVIKVVISKGKLKMPKFDSYTDFREWADKYGISYEEKHEFSDEVEVGEVISYSYKKGDTIKNNDTIIVTISDGKKIEVPDLEGMKKDDIISKLKKLDLEYNFVYKNSSRISKDKAISQSIKAGSKVSKNTTITITLSNGKKEEASSTSNSSSSSSKTNNNNNNSNSGSSNSSGSSNPQPSPSPSCEKDTQVFIYDELISSTPSTTCSKIKSAYPKLKFSCSYVEDGGLANGLLKNSSSVDGSWRSTCETISLVIVKND